MDANPPTVVRLRNAWRSSHPWIFQKLVEKPAVRPKPGVVVDIVGVEGEWIGRGFYNGHSRIAVRILETDPQVAVDQAWFARKIAAAVSLRRDVIVRLPDERRIVVDSKVNLIAWQEAVNADTPEGQHEAMRRHTVALRQHVKDLCERDYPRAVGASALEVTIAFVPIEGALSAALGFDDLLQTDAFDKGVVFASPNTLMATLRVIERLWTRDKLQKQALKISDAGSLLMDSVVNFLTDFASVGASLDGAQKAFNAARNRLEDSPQAVIPRARRLVELGAKGKKKLPPDLQPDDADPEGARLEDAER